MFLFYWDEEYNLYVLFIIENFFYLRLTFPLKFWDISHFFDIRMFLIL